MEKLDVNLSVGGKNRYTLWCKEVEQRRFYGSCLCVMDGYKSGRLDGNNPVNTCAFAMQHSRCPAISMREEELVKGEAIYYTSPVQTASYENPNINKASESYIRGWNQVGSSLGSEDDNIAEVKKPAKKPAPVVSVGQSSMAEVITQELKKEQENNAKIAKLREMKDEIAKLAQTDPAKARVLLTEAQKLKDSIVIRRG